MPAPRPNKTALRVAELSSNGPTPFELRPAKSACAALAEALEFDALRKLSFTGSLRPLGERDWEMRAQLGATVVQPCVATLEPVTTRIDTVVTRRFLHDMTVPEESEAEMPQDDTVEPLPDWIDPAAVMAEALALAAPDYPRKDGAEVGSVQVTEGGKAPLQDEDLRPFAGLADLKAQLEDKKDE